MLPLWIIDLNNDIDRREHLCELLQSLKEVDNPLTGRFDPSKDETEEVKALTDSIEKPFSSVLKSQWFYTNYLMPEWDYDVWLPAFVDDLVKQGQDYVRKINEYDPTNECCLNVCVLGDSTELHTLKLFSALAAILKKEKTRFLPNHIQQGINVVGMLYVPSDINTRPFEERQCVLRCLKELNIQHDVDEVSGYDKVLLYQDTQHRTEKLYPSLNKVQQMEYVFQCIVHLFYVCDETHPLLENASSNDDLFVSLGTASLYYDTREQDNKDLLLLLQGVIDTFKMDASLDTGSNKVRFLKDGQILTPDYLITSVLDLDPNLNEIEVPSPRPHPVDDFSNKFLKRFFYQHWLRKYLSELLNRITNKFCHPSKEEKSFWNLILKVNDSIAIKRKEITEHWIPDAINRVLRNSSSIPTGGVKLIKSKFAELRDDLVHYKDELKERMDDVFWQPHIEDIPKQYSDSFVDYHDAYKADIAAPQSARRDELKKRAVDRLINHLKNATPILARIGRATLLGVVLTLSVMLIIELFFAFKGDLSSIRHFQYHLDYMPGENKWIFIYAFFLFLIPAIWQLIDYYFYKKRLHKYQNDLYAYYLHDAYEKLANRAENQICELYCDIIEVCNSYEERCDTMIKDDSICVGASSYDASIPKTMFNQPLLGGKCVARCSGEKDEVYEFFPNKNINYNVVNLGGERIRVDLLNEDQQYYLIHKESDTFFELFKDVVPENLKIKDPETGKIRRKTNEELEVEKRKRWEKVKHDFINCFITVMYPYLLPRQDASIGEKLNQYRRDDDNRKGFDLLTRFCANSGEFAANDDSEYADLKSNSELMCRPNAFGGFLPRFSTEYQVIKDNRLFTSHVFLTRWRTYDVVHYNRILPETDLSDEELDKPASSTLLLYSLQGAPSVSWYELLSSKVILDFPEQYKFYVNYWNSKK